VYNTTTKSEDIIENEAEVIAISIKCSFNEIINGLREKQLRLLKVSLFFLQYIKGIKRSLQK